MAYQSMIRRSVQRHQVDFLSESDSDAEVSAAYRL